MEIRRRTILASLLTAGFVFPQASPAAVDTPAFSFDGLKDRALALARRAHRPDDSSPLPQSLRDLDYSRFQTIKFRPDQALWQDGGLFQVQFVHRGFQFNRKVAIHLIENGEIRDATYSPMQFDFGSNELPGDFPASLGFAGFRLHFPLNRPDRFEEFAVFLGASNFRLIGRGQIYGASARGLAIDVAGSQGESFPVFTDFWLERPAPDVTTITVYALLDSKSVAGAYKFAFSPAADARVQVEAELFLRSDIEKLGLAPIASAFLHGKPGNRPFLDLRPELHDSDAILLHRGNGEWLSRPLLNPRSLRVSAFADQGPKGFGLVQRERAFAQYEDPVNQYHLRPSLWVEPLSDWGAGAVELVEIPSDSEINDNIVAYWVPHARSKAGTSIAFAYRLTAQLDPGPPKGGRCIATRNGPTTPIDAQREPSDNGLQFWLDFTGGELPSLSDAMPLEAVVSTSDGKVGEVTCRKIDATIWRTSFIFRPNGRKNAELRAFLRLRSDALSETWSYRWGA